MLLSFTPVLPTQALGEAFEQRFTSAKTPDPIDQVSEIF
jgi:hypothetical protein